MLPSHAVKIPAAPVRSVAANATVPRLFAEGKRPKLSKSSPGLRDGPDGSAAAYVDALDAVLPIGAEHHVPVPVNHG